LRLLLVLGSRSLQGGKKKKKEEHFLSRPPSLVERRRKKKKKGEKANEPFISILALLLIRG